MSDGIFGPCCTGGDCCGPGSYCCSNTGPHTHPEENGVTAPQIPALCPACGGTGLTVRLWSLPTTYPCNRCGGSGRNNHE